MTLRSVCREDKVIFVFAPAARRGQRAAVLALLSLASSWVPVQRAWAGCEIGIRPAYWGSNDLWAVSLSGNLAVLGDPREDSQSGKAYVFEYDGVEWTQTATLTASDGEINDEFGVAVDNDGDRIVVGAWSRNRPGYNGAAYAFRKVGTEWIQEAILTAPTFGSAVGFGTHVAVSGNVIAVSATACCTMPPNEGLVHVYRHNGSSWVHDAEIRPSTTHGGDGFGSALALEPDRLLVGASGHDLAVTDGGAAFLFAYNGGLWTEEAMFAPGDLQAYDYFGSAVAIQGDYLAIGTPYPDNESGRVLVYSKTGTAWVLHDTLTPIGFQAAARFGEGLAIDNGILAVGAGHAETPFSDEGGIAYLYGLDAGGALELTQLYPEEWTRSFGKYTDMSDGWVLVSPIQSMSGDADLFPIGQSDPDCNGNGINDACELDCDHSGVADDCEGFGDCDASGLLDTCDIELGFLQDCDGNWIPDDCEDAPWEHVDCNGDAIPDLCDIATGASPDCNQNLIPDECDIASGTSTDCDADFTPDECQPLEDCNGNGVFDACDVADGTSTDCDANIVPDECDPDCNGNAIPDRCDIADGTSADCQGNGVADECETDCNLNGNPDDCDIAAGVSDDCNADVIPDECQPAEDCNGNGTQDICDIGAGTAPDCNRNLRPDDCDIADGISTDDNANGIPDTCEGRPMPDTAFDINGTIRTCTTDDDCLVGIRPNSNVYCVPAPLELPDAGTCYVQRGRYISINPSRAFPGTATARRVSLVLNGGSTVVLGWVGEPTAKQVTGGPWDGPEETSPQLLSRIEAEPHYRDWAVDNDGLPWVDPTVHLGDCEISPGHTYRVRSIPAGADILDEVNYSAPLELRTSTYWGDVRGDSMGEPPDGIRNFKDINSAVHGFQGTQLEPKVWLDSVGGAAAPETPDFTDISFADINATIFGFQGAAYPYAAPLECPDQLGP